ncbi:hypothetical protein AAFF_G00165180 [Aldrovandia affinis]|uniref:Uncharacterized protein n=1 Tax=Aldrovandia affinis TaxID=143900 RepID=A0AAD7W7B6_9TELE|nr:hypothetical protein AAFF_G00165180 [Aldrovandia affinis]
MAFMQCFLFKCAVESAGDTKPRAGLGQEGDQRAPRGPRKGPGPGSPYPIMLHQRCVRRSTRPGYETLPVINNLCSFVRHSYPEWTYRAERREQITPPEGKATQKPTHVQQNPHLQGEFGWVLSPVRAALTSRRFDTGSESGSEEDAAV